MKSVLIIEDDLDIRMSLQELLESEDFKVDVAENGKVGLTLLTKYNLSPDIILLDLFMPVMDGNTFIEEINSNYPEITKIPIIVMTAAPVNNYPKGFDLSRILKKPIEIDELFNKMDLLLEGHQ